VGFRIASLAPATGDVSNLRAFNPQATCFAWDVVPGASGEGYDLVRGEVANLSGDASGVQLGPLTCIENDSPDPTSQSNPDDTAPAAGAVRRQRGVRGGRWWRRRESNPRPEKIS